MDFYTRKRNEARAVRSSPSRRDVSKAGIGKEGDGLWR